MIVITGGGTGGHLRIAQLVKKELAARGEKALYIGSTGGQDRQWFEGDDDFVDTLFLDSKGVMNKGAVGKIFQVWKILSFAFRLGSIFRQYGITKVFSVGGYSAAPAVFAAIIFRKKLYIHEQNAKTGALNRVTRPFAKAFFSSFDPGSPCHNYPVDNRFFSNRRIRGKIEGVLFMGGSLGARAINDLALESAEAILQQGIKIIHLTGERDFERVSRCYREKGLDIEVAAFSEDIDLKMAESDFAVARAGASSLFELYANALPTLFIPYPYAASDHQYYNAKMLESKGLAYCIREKDISSAYLLDLLQKEHTGLSQKLYDSFNIDGTSCITDRLMS